MAEKRTTKAAKKTDDEDKPDLRREGDGNDPLRDGSITRPTPTPAPTEKED